MPPPKPSTERLQLTLSIRTLGLLSVLGDKGTHGIGGTDAAKTLIEQGLRDAIRDGFLTPDDVRRAETYPR